MFPDIDTYRDPSAGPAHDPLLVAAYLNTDLARVRSGRLRGPQLKGLDGILAALAGDTIEEDQP